MGLADRYDGRPMASHLPKLRFAAQTDVGQRRLANEDAYAIDPRMNLFVVCDGVGGRPSGEAASQIIANTLAHTLRRRLRGIRKLDESILKTLLIDAVVSMNQQLYAHSQPVPALTGMGCTLVAALFDARSAFYVHAGDSRLYLLRAGKLRPLTADHTHTRQTFQAETETGDLIDVGERRLLTQYLGTSRELEPTAASLPLQVGDRLLLCSDGLTDPVNDEVIRHLLRRHEHPAEASQALINAANQRGGPDNITVAVIDYAGLRRVTDDDRLPPRPKPQSPQGIAERTRQALAALEQDLIWLKQGALESAHPTRLTALAAAKRRLGGEAFRQFLSRDPNQSPSHVFHQCCAHPDSPWRQQYQGHLSTLEESLNRIMAGDIRLSPLLWPEQTSAIYRELWRSWRNVEQRYFANCQHGSHHESDQTLNILIDHMLHSVQTITGLLYFLPRFMRQSA